MNRIEVRYFAYDNTTMIWVKNSKGQMLESLPFLSEKQLNEVCRDFDAYVDIDERE